MVVTEDATDPLPAVNGAARSLRRGRFDQLVRESLVVPLVTVVRGGGQAPTPANRLMHVLFLGGSSSVLAAAKRLLLSGVQEQTIHTLFTTNQGSRSSNARSAALSYWAEPIFPIQMFPVSSPALKTSASEDNEISRCAISMFIMERCAVCE